MISLVGYTNAGKSTLLNTLTKSEIHGRGQAVRHPRSDQPPAQFPDDMEVIITDTVGFIRNLPADLLKALWPPWRNCTRPICSSMSLMSPTPRIAKRWRWWNGC